MTMLTDQNRQKIRAELHNRQGLLKVIKAEIKERSLQITKLDPESRPYRENMDRITGLEGEEKDLTGDITKLEKQLRTPEEDQLTIEQFLNLSKNASIIVQSADERAKDIICRQIFLNFFVDESKVASYQLKEPFATLLKHRKILTGRDLRKS